MMIKAIQTGTLLMLAMLASAPEASGQQPRAAESARARMRRLLSLPQEKAPRAALVVGRDQDQGMPVAGLKKLEQEVKAAYARRGATDRFAVHITAGDHTYTEEMFEQVSQWFRRFLK